MKTATWVILAAMVAATSAWAQPGQDNGMKNRGKSDGQGRGFNKERMAEKLALSPDQMEKLEALQHDWQTQQVDLRAASQKAKLELRRVMREPEATRDDLLKAVEADNAADLAMARARVDHFLKVRELLGPEKAAMMIEMRASFRDDERGRGDAIPRGGHNRGPGPMGGPGEPDQEPAE